MSADEVIGRYRVDRELGSGTFATVYRAHDEALDVPVALKVLGENWSYDPDVRRRFINEAQLLRRASGRHVVRVHDIGQTDDGRPFFVMDFADRGTVEERLRELAQGGVTVHAEDVRRFVDELAAGVAEVHQLGVVHRDLKPSNLLLRSGVPAATPGAVGGTIVRFDEVLLVGDLGFARDVDGPTRLTAAVGTEGYMAPEQRDLAARLDGRADVYACSAIVERLLLGRDPEGTPPAPPDDAPTAVRTLFARGLAVDPAERFATVEEWRIAANAALAESGGTVALDPGRNAAAAALVSLSKVSDDWAPRLPAGTARRSRRPWWMAGVGAAVVVALVAVGAFLLRRDDDAATPPPGDAARATVPPSVDPRPVAETRLLDPIDVAVDANGAVLVSQVSANRVRRIEGSTVSTVAGTGQAGEEGDGGAATRASLATPTGISTGADGSVYVADALSGAVRRIAPNGTITTIAGGASSGDIAPGMDATDAPISSLDVAAAPDGTAYITDATNHRLWKVGSDHTLAVAAGTGVAGYAGDGGVATDAALNRPSSVVVTADGHVYLSDYAANVVRRISPDGRIATVAGSGAGGFAGDGGPATRAQLQAPDGIALAPDGTLYIADTGNQRIRKVSPTGVITTVAGNGRRGPEADSGHGTDFALSDPGGLAVTRDGAVVFADTYANRVRALAPDGTVTTLAGTGPAGAAGDNGPAATAVVRDPTALAFAPNGDLFVAEGTTGLVRRIDTKGVITTVAGQATLPSLAPGPAIDAAIDGPSGIAVDGRGAVYVAELINSVVRSFSVGGAIEQVAGTGTGGFSGDGGPPASAQLNGPYGVAAAPDGTLVVADGGNLRVRRVGAGTITTIAGNGLPAQGVARPAPATSVGLSLPVGVAVGANGAVFVAEATGNRVRRIDPDGTMTVIAGTGSAGYSGDGERADTARLSEPFGVAVTGNGTVYVVERDGNRVRRVGADGTIGTVAGTGEAGDTGDGGEATLARLNRPRAAAIAPDGSVFIADTGNNRIRRIARDGTITTVAGAL